MPLPRTRSMSHESLFETTSVVSMKLPSYSSFSIDILDDEVRSTFTVEDTLAKNDQDIKRVRFAADPLVHEYETSSFDRDQVFYSRQEYSDFREQVSELSFSAEYMPRDTPEGHFCATILALHKACREGKDELTSSSLPFCNLYGLERSAVPALSRSKHEALEEMMDRIFEIQEDVLLDPEDQADMIREQCEALSAPFQRFAQRLASF